MCDARAWRPSPRLQQYMGLREFSDFSGEGPFDVTLFLFFVFFFREESADVCSCAITMRTRPAAVALSNFFSITGS